MDVRIQSIHFDASEQLQAFIQKKVSKLEKYYEDIKKVEVSLKVVKPEVAENKEAGIYSEESVQVGKILRRYKESRGVIKGS